MTPTRHPRLHHLPRPVAALMLLAALALLSLVPGAVGTSASSVPSVAPLAAAAQDQQPQAPRPTFETGAELVLVDVNVVDKNGSPIQGLDATDFELQVNGRRRRIDSVQFVSTLPPPGAPPRTARDAAYTTNDALTTGRLLLFVIDESNLRVGSGRTVLKTAQLLMDRLAPGDLIGLARIPSGRGGVEFTTDRERIGAALQRVTGTASARNTFSRLRISEAYAYDTHDSTLWDAAIARECSGETFGPAREACIEALQGDAWAMLAEYRARAQATLQSLEGLMERLATLSTPVNIVMISEGMFVARDRQNMSDLARLAASARATLHIVRPGQTFFDVEEQTTERASAFYDDSLLNEGLEQLAGQTRGTLTQVSGGSGAAVFDRLGRELSGYYLIGFEPTDEDRTGDERRIKVEVRQKGVTVRARPTFAVRSAAATADADAAAALAELDPVAEVREMLGQPLPTRGLPIRLATYATAGATPDEVRLIISAELGEPATEGATWEVGMLLLDKDDRAVMSNLGAIPLEPASAETASPRLLLTSLTVKPGEYTLRLAVADDTGRGGSVHHAVDARLQKVGGLAISDLLIGYEPLGGVGPTRLRPSAVMDSPILTATLEVNGKDPRELEGARVRIEVSETPDGPALVSATTGRAQRDDPTRRAYGGTLRLGLLPPGEYFARAVISAPGQKATTVLRPFRLTEVAARTAEAGEGAPLPNPDLDPDAALPPPPPTRILAPVPSFVPGFVVRPDVVRPFLDGLVALHPPSHDLDGVIEKARVGTYDAPEPEMRTPEADRAMLTFIRGLEALEKNRVAQARAWFQQTALTAGDFIGAAFYLGACHAADGRDLDAIGAWQMALLSENPAVVYPLLVDALLRVGDGQGALEFIGEAPDVWTDEEDRLRREATANAMIGSYAEAMPVLVKLIDAHPGDTSLLFMGLQVLYRQHLDRGGLDDAGKARFAEYADRYKAGGGREVALIESWRKFVLR
ncbi:MAG: VWA domain-containing protein [Vicinamibacterales bacterium]